MFTRVANKDHFVGKIPVKKGTLIGFQSTANHHDPKFFKNPYEFRPERWEK